MSEGATSGDREQQKRDNNASRRQSGLEPRPQDREDSPKHASGPKKRAQAESADDRGNGGNAAG